jgi:single-stranded DNA-binding protein
VIAGLVAGRLAAAPTSRIAKNGRAYATCRLRCSVGDEPAMVNGIAFNSTVVKQLLALSEGDSVAISGELEITRTWTDREGNIRPSIDMKIFALLTEYHVKRRREAMSEGKSSKPAQQATDTGVEAGLDDSDQLDQLQF